MLGASSCHRDFNRQLRRKILLTTSPSLPCLDKFSTDLYQLRARRVANQISFSPSERVCQYSVVQHSALLLFHRFLVSGIFPFLNMRLQALQSALCSHPITVAAAFDLLETSKLVEKSRIQEEIMNALRLSCDQGYFCVLDNLFLVAGSVFNML